MRVYDGELCDCGCTLMETHQGLFCPECGKVVATFEEAIRILLNHSVAHFREAA